MSQIGVGACPDASGSLTRPAAATAGSDARQRSSSPVAAGELRSRASRAASQIGRGGPDGPSDLTLPAALIAGGPGRVVKRGASQISPMASRYLPERPCRPMAT